MRADELVKSCPACSSHKTFRVAEHFGEVSFFCMDCGHTWSIRLPRGAQCPMLMSTESAPIGDVCDESESPRDERQLSDLFRRSQAGIERARELLADAAHLQRYCAHQSRIRALLRSAANALH